MVIVLFMYLGYFIVACLIASACMRIRYGLIKYINFVSPNKRILLTKNTYSGFYIPVNSCFPMLIVASLMEADQVILLAIAISCSIWLISNTVKLAKSINNVKLNILIIPAIYLSLPLAFIGVYGGFVVNLIWAVTMQSSRYQGNTDIIRNYMR